MSPDEPPSRDKSVYATHLADFLRIHQPDVVHFQHIHSIGWDAVSHTRRVLPDVPIVTPLAASVTVRPGSTAGASSRAPP